MTPTPILDRIKDREDAKVIRLSRQPRWLERRQAEHRGESPWVAVKDVSEWRPDPAA